MRENKFRGLDVENNWVYGGYCFDGENEFIVNARNSYRPFIIIRKGTGGQYIGQKDKSGKELYIGDIIRLNNKNYDPDNELYYEGIAVVQSTKELGYQIKPIKPIPDEWEFDSTSMWHVGEGDTTEIIGNIYEDKNLLDNRS